MMLIEAICYHIRLVQMYSDSCQITIVIVAVITRNLMQMFHTFH